MDSIKMDKNDRKYLKRVFLASAILFFGIILAIAQPAPNTDGNTRRDVQIRLPQTDSGGLQQMGITSFTYADSFCEERICHGLMTANTGLELPYYYQIQIFDQGVFRNMTSTELAESIETALRERISLLVRQFNTEQARTFGREGDISLQ